MSLSFPEPDTLYPVVLPDGSAHRGTVFLRAAITHPRIEVGAYSYYSDHDPAADPADYAARLAPYLYAFSPERLVIGKFCQIASGVQFITASANHRRDGISTYPFAIFGGPREGRPSMPDPGRDTCIGHDVWIGTGARILPGARIGSGTIIGAGAIVGGDAPPYSVIYGDAARPRRLRFNAQTIARLLAIAWWDWPIAHILKHEAAIAGADVDALERAAAAPRQP